MDFRENQERTGTHMTERMELVEEEVCTKEVMEKEMLVI